MGSLRFDGIQRYKTIAEIFSRLGVSQDCLILDVGGGTGGLAEYLGSRSYYTIDPTGGGPNHVRASMRALPFPSESFDLVLMVDALEHVSDHLRPVSLSEMVRVARDRLLWIGPVKEDLTIRVEEDLRDAHLALTQGREMDWLREHRENGLPNREQVVEILAGGCRDWISWPSCHLMRWWALTRLGLQLEASVFQPDLIGALNVWYKESGWREDYRIDPKENAYRMVFVGRKAGRLPSGLDTPPLLENPLEKWRSFLPLIEVVARPGGLSAAGEPLDSAAGQQLAKIAEILEKREPSTSFLARWFGGRR